MTHFTNLETSLRPHNLQDVLRGMEHGYMAPGRLGFAVKVHIFGSRVKSLVLRACNAEG